MTQRVTARTTAVLSAISLFLGHAAVASAQQDPPPPPPPGAADRIAMVTTFLRPTSTGAVLVRDTWQPRGRDGRRACEVTLQRYDAHMAPVGRPQSIYRGAPVRAAIAVKGESVLVAMVNGSATPFVKVAFAPERGAPTTSTVARLGSAGTGVAPSSVVATDTPEGFTVLWQEEPSAAGNRSASSYMVLFGADGAARGPAHAVGVPWALGALAWNGNGYHLAAFFDGASRGQTRICLVTLTTAGMPEQHPWWASPPGDPSDVQLTQSPAGMVALYRGGEGGSHVYTFTSDAIGQWGREAPQPRELGTVDAAEPVGLRLDAAGAPQIVSVPRPAHR